MTGNNGNNGINGAAATIAVGTVTALPAGSTPTIVNAGTTGAAVFNFGLVTGNTGATGATSTSASIWYDECIFSVGTTLTWSATVTMWYNTLQYQSPFAAAGNSFSYPFPMAAGTYTMYIMGGTNASGGIITWYIDGVSQGTTDTYASGSTTRTQWTAAVTVVGTGMHTLQGSVLTKNGASGGYATVLNKMWIR